jgi:ribose transport system ATP-binding protein
MTPEHDPNADAPAVQLRSISKYFGENQVLTDVDLSFSGGRIHAVLGANGSGKSTLIKILAGYHLPTAGSILLHGEEVALPTTPRALHEAGVRFVHQDLGLFETLSIADNLALSVGYETAGPAISWRAQARAARIDLASVGLGDLDPEALVSTLGPVQKTLVAMARAVRDIPAGRGVLVLDEPTARLPHDQVDALLERCRALRDEGIALVYVSHRLDEVFAMADEVTVLRDGRVVLSAPLVETTEEALTATITGQGERAAGPTRRRSAPAPGRGEQIMALRGVSGVRVDDVSLDLHAGEILAITGLIGSGRSELGRIVFGAQQATSGEMRFRGELLERPTPTASVRRGIGYVPQDRSQGGFRTFDLPDNLCLADLSPYLRNGVLSPTLRRQAAERAIEQLDVQPADVRRLLGELSGGNQQKVILGKWLELPLQLLVLDEPTYGVDVGAREGLMRTIVEQADRGLSVLLLDSDIDLVASYADRVLVMQRGRITTELRGDAITQDAVAAASYAVAPPAHAAATMPGATTAPTREPKKETQP